jgi:2-hydroxycyclohexanecarboxyl-CoA dehydrogenase
MNESNITNSIVNGTFETGNPPVAAVGFDFSEAGIVIAGGTSGVGLASAIAFARAGATRIAVIGRNADRGSSAVSSINAAVPGVKAEFVAADINKADSAGPAIAEAHRRLGRIDVLVNSSVAVYQPKPLGEIPPEELANILVQQATGPMLTSQAALPIMRSQGGGSIINIASDAAKVPTPGETGIGAAMAAINTFTRTMAMEARRYGIRVNGITPSLIVNTGSYDRAMNEEFSKKIFSKIVSQAHLGMTEPEDLANTILFLASPLSRRITGQIISVNGGISIA